MCATDVKRRLEAGGPPVGTRPGLPIPEAAEYVAMLGFD